MTIAVAVTAVLVTLGAVVIYLRNSNETGEGDTVTATDDAAPGADTDADTGSGGDGPTDAKNPCDLLTEGTAEDVAGMDLEYTATAFGSTGSGACTYVALDPNSTVLVEVVLDRPDMRRSCSGDGECGPPDAPHVCLDDPACEVVEEAVPSLPHGTFAWYSGAFGLSDPTDPPLALWVEWTSGDRTWWLILQDNRAPFQEDLNYREDVGPETFRMDTLSRKEALVAAAEAIYAQMT